MLVFRDDPIPYRMRWLEVKEVTLLKVLLNLYKGFPEVFNLCYPEKEVFQGVNWDLGFICMKTFIRYT